MLDDIEAVAAPATLIELQASVRKQNVSDPLIDYVQALVRHTRESADIEVGLSPRGAQALIKAARARSFIENLKPAGSTRFRSPSELCQHVLDSVAIP